MSICAPHVLSQRTLAGPGVFLLSSFYATNFFNLHDNLSDRISRFVRFVFTPYVQKKWKLYQH